MVIVRMFWFPPVISCHLNRSSFRIFYLSPSWYTNYYPSFHPTLEPGCISGFCVVPVCINTKACRTHLSLCGTGGSQLRQRRCSALFCYRVVIASGTDLSVATEHTFFLRKRAILETQRMMMRKIRMQHTHLAPGHHHKDCLNVLRLTRIVCCRSGLHLFISLEVGMPWN